MVFYNGIILVEKSNEKEGNEGKWKKVGFPSAPNLALGKDGFAECWI